MNIAARDRGEGIPVPSLELEEPAVKTFEAKGQKVSLVVAVLVVAFYLLSSLWIAAHRLFWFDELWTVLIARLPNCSTIWKALCIPIDAMPPTYFYLVRLFDRALGPSELAARIPSALAMAAGLWITFDCARRLTDNMHALASLGLLSCSFLPYYGYEARPYALFFMFSAVQLWLWCHTPNNRKSAVLFGVAFFLAFNVHYYSVFCIVPYAAFEASRWKPWKAPSPKLLAGTAGLLCGVALFSMQIAASHAASHGFWNPPHRPALFGFLGQVFPLALFVGTVALIWVAWTARPEKLTTDPMPAGERVGWFFLLIPFAGFVVAKLVTHAFYDRYFIGVLPGVALALTCALWRHFHRRPVRSAGIVLIMLLVGVDSQISATAKPWQIDPESSSGEAASLRDALAFESAAIKDGKKNIALSANDVIGPTLLYYSAHPELYALLLAPPDMGTIAGGNRTMNRYYPRRLWSLDDLRASARDTALINPPDAWLKAMTDSGFRIKLFQSGTNKIAYFE
jgi:4-amino-4-deoxy-L-arabinose transferase-like glycosyltransferase